MKLFNIFTSKEEDDSEGGQPNDKDKKYYVTEAVNYNHSRPTFTIDFLLETWSVNEYEFYRVEEQFFKQYDGNSKVFEGKCPHYDKEKRLYSQKLCKEMHRFWYKNKENLLASKRFGRCDRCKLGFLEKPRWNQKYCSRDWCGWQSLLHCWYDYQCARCEEDLTLRIHHLDENPSDSSKRNQRKDFIEKCKRFIVLCPTCHEGYHSKKLLKEELENYHKKLPSERDKRLKRLSEYALSKYGHGEPKMDWQNKLSDFEDDNSDDSVEVEIVDEE